MAKKNMLMIALYMQCVTLFGMQPTRRLVKPCEKIIRNSKFLKRPTRGVSTLSAGRKIKKTMPRLKTYPTFKSGVCQSALHNAMPIYFINRSYSKMTEKPKLGKNKNNSLDYIEIFGERIHSEEVEKLRIARFNAKVKLLGWSSLCGGYYFCVWHFLHNPVGGLHGTVLCCGLVGGALLAIKHTIICLDDTLETSEVSELEEEINANLEYISKLLKNKSFSLEQQIILHRDIESLFKKMKKGLAKIGKKINNPYQYDPIEKKMLKKVERLEKLFYARMHADKPVKV